MRPGDLVAIAISDLASSATRSNWSTSRAAYTRRHADVSLLRFGVPEGVRVLRSLRCSARLPCSDRGAQGRHRAVLRPGRFHRPLRRGRSRGRPGTPSALPRAPPPRDRTVRGDGRQVHRRRGYGGVRHPQPRGRPRAGGAVRARDGGGGPGAEPRAAGSRSGGPDRPHHRRGGRDPRWKPGNRRSGRRRGQHRRPFGRGGADRRGGGRRADLGGDQQAVRLRAAPPRAGQGQVGAPGDLAGSVGPKPPRRWRRRQGGHAVRGPRPGTRPAPRHLRPGDSGGLCPAGHHRG
jgi:hypothetical protein